MRNAERSFCAGMALLAACQPATKVAEAPRKPSETAHYLGESFEVEGGHCTLASAELALTEPRLRPIGRPPEDVSVVAVRLQCDAEGLASTLQLRWLDDALREHAQSTRTALSEREPELALFEVPARESGVVLARRYDARTGDPRGKREQRRARLLVEDKQRTRAIAPWPRQHTAALDDFLDRLARTLASGAPFDTLSDSEPGHAAIRASAELYTRSAGHADHLVVRTLALPRITLALRQGGGGELLHFTLELDDKGERVLRAHDLEQARAAVQCVEDEAALRARMEQRAQKPDERDCNVLGALLPGECATVEPGLLRDALRLGSRCGIDPALDLDTRARPAPADFELRMRRGRTFFSRLDREPHYTLQITRAGRVHFEGQQRVRALGNHEGRTSQELLAALADRFARMGWFEHQDGQTCQANDDRGDTFEVRAGGRVRTLRDREGCRAGFTAGELALVRRAIERATGVNTWLEHATSDTHWAASPRDTEYWMVAAE